VLCNDCLASRAAQNLIDDKQQLSPILVTSDLRCFGTADAMSGCSVTAPTHLIEARNPEVKQLSGYTVRKALAELHATE
jgi:hypothetical protein